MRVKAAFITVLSFLAIVTSGIAQPQNENEFLEKGLKLEKKNQVNKALDTWEKALKELKNPSLEIGRQYIRLVTEQDLQSRYETASAMYRWGLSGKNVNPNLSAFQKEISMIEPLVDDETYERWKHLLENRDSELFESLRSFWKRVDPTPATSYNERLIEHWERIAYARRHFDRNNKTVYGTDDRGLSWVQFGAPDRRIDGKLKLSSSKAATVIDILDPKLDEVQKQALRNAVVGLHKQPDYDIWIYDNMLGDGDENLIRMFGETPSGRFERLESVSDFIPSRAFSFSSRYEDSRLMSNSDARKNPNVSPGMVLQYIYYEQLATIGGSFASVFNRISSDWEGDGRQGQNQASNISEGPSTSLRAKTTTVQNERSAPPQKSTYEEKLPDIPVEAYQYRILNKENNPVFLTFIESSPQQVFVKDLAVNQDSMFSSKYVSPQKTFQYYKLYHGLQIQNEGGRIISQSRIPSNIILDSTNTHKSSSVFTVPRLPDVAEIELYAELHNTHSNTRPIFSSPFPKSLRGKGDVTIKQQEPLETNREKLQMSDLILGYQMQREKGGGLLPFVVANDRKIPEYENLAVHVEVYHLKTGSNSKGKFQLSYQVLPVESDDWSQAREREFSLTLNMETSKSRFSENLEIKVSDLLPGKYRLQMTATEKKTGRSITREIPFEITEISK